MGRNARAKRDRKEWRKHGVALPAGKDKRYTRAIKEAFFEGRDVSLKKARHWTPISYSTGEE